ncbi:hypothetical protein BY458DRAFT_437110 [Sporodiniella umbellata]|nr:hypothetical protein BY458DRAFT_437110 [Sporodiniella umbellata]
MSDSEIEKSPISTKRARESSIEEDEIHVLKTDPKDQTKLVTQLQQDLLQEGQTWCLISKAWFTRWKQYCSRLSSPQQNSRKLGEQTVPGPINNLSILKENGDLENSLVMDETVYAVPEKAWETLVGWYGTFSRSPIAIERQVIKKESGNLEVELYPPTFHLFVVSEGPSVLEKSPQFTLSELSPIHSLLSAVQESLDLSQDCELQIWKLDHKPDSPTITPSTVQKASVLDTDNKFAALSLSGTLYIAVGVRGDVRYPLELMKVTDSSSSVSSTSSLFANGFNNLTTSTVSTPTASVNRSVRGVCGLQNLGNTCFMNSALQCLSNTPELTKWFLAENYKRELNRDNPLGMKGQVAEAFGELVAKLWSGDSNSTSPRDFKYTIGKFNSSFYGYQQHDTQELLAFLLDGLHEDLNRILKKPYVELPDFEGKEDKEIAECSWNYHLARNDSVIVDYFQGQFKSKLVCSECKNVSVTFDPFMYLSLPLPIKKKSKTTVVYVPYDPTKRMQRVVVTLSKDASIAHLQKKMAEMMSVEDPSTLLVVEIFSHKIYKVFPQYEPVATIGTSDIVYVYQLPGPVPPTPKRRVSYRFGKGSSDDEDDNMLEPKDPEQLIVFPVYCATSEANESTISGQQIIPFGDPFIVAIPYQYANSYSQLHHMVSQHVERYTSFKLFEEVKEQEMEEPPAYEVATNQATQQPIHTTAAVTAAGGKKTEPMSNLFSMKVFSSAVTLGGHSEDLLPCSQSWHPNSLVDLKERFDREQKLREDFNQTDEGDEDKEPVDTEMGEAKEEEEKKEEEFEGDMVEDAAQEFYRSQMPLNEDPLANSDDDSNFSNENQIGNKAESPALSYTAQVEEPARTKKVLKQPPRTIVRQGEGILLEWSSKKAKQIFGESQHNSNSGVSTSGWDEIEDLGDPEEAKLNSSEQKNKQVTLSDCLDEFTKEEALSEEDLWYCPKCKKHQMATKKFDLWHMPEVVVVHLKRFSHSRAFRDKIDVLIDFPIQNLDLSDRVLSIEEGSDERLIYDLYAVDNHYGGLGGGHCNYTYYSGHLLTIVFRYCLRSEL